MTPNPSPAPAQPDQPPQNVPFTSRTWTGTQLAARIQRAAPAPREPQPATPAPALPAPAGKPAKPAPQPDQQPPSAQPAPALFPRVFPYVVLQISPELRERHPEWPLSLEEALNLGKPPADPNPTCKGRARWTEILRTSRAPAEARAIVRDTLTAWGLPGLASDAGQLASELTAAAVEHPAGYPLGLTLDEHKPPGQPRWIYCAVTSYSPRPDPALQPGHAPASGHAPACGPAPGTAIVTASGCDTTPEGTRTWFTLTSPHPAATRTGPERDRELEAGA